ncbi:MAG: hypothetical protein M3Y65_06920 [Pseudomonadota bacterium]|nr:hypothetical protein [Pseudomonadota bacterium]
MKKSLSALMVLALGLTASHAHAHGHTPVPSIAHTDFEQYRAEYGQSPLCTKEEITLWSCERNQRIYSLCSSHSASRTTGYLQYRTSHAGKVTLVYPATKVPPLGLFEYASFPNGDASIRFTNQGYTYSLGDPLRGKSTITVSSIGAPEKTTEIACGPNQTLQVNYTMRLMDDFGVWVHD